jgi:hypothetical protein
MYEKYTFLREESNPLLSTNNSFSSFSKVNEASDISLFCKKFSAMLLEIGCVNRFPIFLFLNIKKYVQKIN